MFQNQGIFRADVLRRHLERKDKPVLLKLISPKTSLFVWVLSGLLFAAALLWLFAEFPAYAPAVAVVVEGRGGRDTPSEPYFVVFMRPEELPNLSGGRRLIVSMNEGKRRVIRSIVAVEPRIFSPREVEERYGLGAFAVSKVSEARAVAIAPLSPTPDDRPPSTYVGSVYDAQVEIGVHRASNLFRR